MAWEDTKLPPAGQKVIDNHTHLFNVDHLPPEFFKVTAEQNYNEDLVQGKKPASVNKIEENIRATWNELTPNKFINQMDDAGIDKSIIFPVDFGLVKGFSEPEIPIHEINEYYSNLANKYPERLVAYATVDPRRDDAPQIIREALDEHGATGIKLHPTTGYHLFDEEAYEILAIADKRDAPVLTDAKPIRAPLKSEYIHPIHLDEVVSDYPDLTLVAAHAGLEWWRDMLVVNSNNLNTGLRIDISSWQKQAQQDPAEFARILREFIDNIGSKRIHWGTDLPGPKVDWLSFIWSLPDTKPGGVQFNREEIKNIVGEAASPLLNKE